MNVPTAALEQAPETVIPDYGNAGVIFRVLFVVNAVILAGSLVHANGIAVALLNFIETSALVEWASLVSIFTLFGLRRLLLAKQPAAMSAWAQRAVCVLVPAAVTGITHFFLSTYDWFRFTYRYLSVGESMLLAALFAAVMQHYFELRARAFSPALSEARLQALQARIRPHFLFNSLNAVLSLIRKEPMRAETALEDLAELFRTAMRDACDMNSLEEEIRMCKQYLSIEQIRLGERLKVHWDTSGITAEDLRTAQIATLMLQPMLENAVNYGVEPARHPSLIEVRVSRSIETVDIVVTNPVASDVGSQAPAVGGNRMALGNIRERLALLYDVEAQLTSGIEDGMFVARLRFPFQRGRP